MKRLYELIGQIKKTKENTTIYCIADSMEDALNQCSEFATNLDYRSNRPLGQGWN